MATTNIIGPLGNKGSTRNFSTMRVVTTNGTTAVNVFVEPTSFRGNVLAVQVISNDTTAGNITVATSAGTVATVAKGVVSGAVTGAVGLTNTAFSLNSSFTVVSSSAGNATVIVFYEAL